MPKVLKHLFLQTGKVGFNVFKENYTEILIKKTDEQ